MNYSSHNLEKYYLPLYRRELQWYMGNTINEELSSKIGDALRKIRLSQSDSLTQAEVADGAGISTRYYAYLELGQKMPSFEVIMKIARAYKMSLSDFTKYFENLL